MTVSEANARFDKRYGHSVAAAAAGPSPFDVYVTPSKVKTRPSATRGKTETEIFNIDRSKLTSLDPYVPGWPKVRF